MQLCNHGVMDGLGRFAKLELHSLSPSATLTLLSCLATSRLHPLLHWLHATRLPLLKYNIPNIQVCGLMGPFWLVLCLVVNIYNIQTPAIRMRYHPSVVCQFAHILFLSILTYMYMHLGVRTLCIRQTVTWYINTLLERRRQSGFWKDEKFAS